MAKTKLYTPYNMSKMSNAEINKEYSRLRAIANKRIARLTAQGYNPQGSKPFATIQQINESSKWNVASQLAVVSRFLISDRTTVKGAKIFYNDFRESMIERGYGDLVKDINSTYNTIKYLETLREQHSDKLFDSGDALDVLQEGQRLNIPIDKLIDNYNLFADNLEAMEKLKPSRNGREFSQRRIDNLIKKWS